MLPGMKDEGNGESIFRDFKEALLQDEGWQQPAQAPRLSLERFSLK